MKEKLIGILGLNKQASEEDIIEKVFALRNELHGKMGYVSAGIVEKMIRDGILRFDEATQSYTCRVSKDFLDRYLIL